MNNPDDLDKIAVLLGTIVANKINFLIHIDNYIKPHANKGEDLKPLKELKLNKLYLTIKKISPNNILGYYRGDNSIAFWLKLK